VHGFPAVRLRPSAARFCRPDPVAAGARSCPTRHRGSKTLVPNKGNTAQRLGASGRAGSADDNGHPRRGASSLTVSIDSTHKLASIRRSAVCYAFAGLTLPIGTKANNAETANCDTLCDEFLPNRHHVHPSATPSAHENDRWIIRYPRAGSSLPSAGRHRISVMARAEGYASTRDRGAIYAI
jgi:hypothetical protein